MLTKSVPLPLSLYVFPMSSLTYDNTTLTFYGEFTMKTITNIRKEYAPLLTRISKRLEDGLTIDLTEIKRIDTAGFVMIIDTIRNQYHGKRINIIKPEKISRFAQIYDLTKVLEKYAVTY